MPPRLRTSTFSSALPSCPSARPQPQSITQNAHNAREFSQSSCRQVTLRRRRFYEWLNGPGAALKKPLPKSTNYLGAYDKSGTLVRGNRPEARPSEKPAEEEKKVEDGQESIDKLDEAARAEAKAERASKKDDNELPPETAEDLRPFPLNRFFRSQPVLSEELREAIYTFVVKEEKTVALASVTFGVSNERIGAVVRLKQLEKQWVAQVCRRNFLPSPQHDETQKIRLVFKTPTWLHLTFISDFANPHCSNNILSRHCR